MIYLIFLKGEGIVFRSFKFVNIIPLLGDKEGSFLLVTRQAYKNKYLLMQETDLEIHQSTLQQNRIVNKKYIE